MGDAANAQSRISKLLVGTNHHAGSAVCTLRTWFLKIGSMLRSSTEHRGCSCSTLCRDLHTSSQARTLSLKGTALNTVSRASRGSACIEQHQAVSTTGWAVREESLSSFSLLIVPATSAYHQTALIDAGMSRCNLHRMKLLHASAAWILVNIGFDQGQS